MHQALSIGVRGAGDQGRDNCLSPMEDTDVTQVKTVPQYKLPASAHLF